MTRFNSCLWYVSVIAIGLIAASAPGCGCPQTPPSPPETPQPEDTNPPSDKTPEEAEAEIKPAPDAEEPEAQADQKETPAERVEEKKPKPQSADSDAAGEESAASGSGASPPGSETKSGGASAGDGGAAGGGGAAEGADAGSPSGNGKGAGGLLGAKQPPRTKAKPKGDPQAARKTGREQLAAANKAAAKGDHAQAFQDAVRGWQAVAPFKNDAECRRLTAELRKRMEKFGAEANTGVSADSSKTLIVE